MKKPLPILILITAVFAAFTAGFLLGRTSADAQVQISAYTPSGSIPVQAGSAQNTVLPTPEAPEQTSTQTEPVPTDNPGDGRININTATVEELVTLPGIGEVLAQRIVDYREANGPYKTITELTNVSGIGEKRMEAILDLVTVGG